jgi:TusA-related sulfurtransferase
MDSANVTQSCGVDAHLDITGETCPMTYVRTRLALDRLRSGQVLEVRLRGADPAANVPRTALQQGHAVLSQQVDEGGVTVLRLRRA